MNRRSRTRLGLAVLGVVGGLGCGCSGDRQLVGGQLTEAGTSAGGASAGAGAAAISGAGGGVMVADGSTPPDDVPSNCLFPRRLVEPLAGKADVGDYAPSPPLTVDVPVQRWGGLGGVLDVNGDWVSDVIFLDATLSRYRLLLSAPPPQVLDLQEVGCDALDALPVGRMFVRDLDADGAPDFVIGLERGVVAFLNRPAGLERVLDFEFAGATERAELINLDVIDLNDDGRVDLVAGYDRLQSTADSMFDTGALSFTQAADGSFAAGESVTSSWSGAAPYEGSFELDGYLAAGHFRSSGAPSVIVAGYERESDQAVAIETDFSVGSTPTKVLIAEQPESVYQVFALPLADGLDLLAVVGRQTLHVMDLRDGAPVELYSVPLAYPGGTSHELGGGAESPRYYFVDVDRDGDADFFERSPDAPRELTLHVNLANAAFAEPQVLAVGAAAFAEAPFMDVGPQRGVIDEVLDSAAESAYRAEPTIYLLLSSGVGSD